MRKVRDMSDKDYYVYLLDKRDQRRISVGIFWGHNETEALTQAAHKYPKIFRDEQLRNWERHAEQIQRRALT